MQQIKIVETQNAIIQMQAKIIDELFLLLAQHITAEELDNMPCIEKINTIAQLKNDIKE